MATLNNEAPHTGRQKKLEVMAPHFPLIPLSAGTGFTAGATSTCRLAAPLALGLGENPAPFHTLSFPGDMRPPGA